MTVFDVRKAARLRTRPSESHCYEERKHALETSGSEPIRNVRNRVVRCPAAFGEAQRGPIGWSEVESGLPLVEVT